MFKIITLAIFAVAASAIDLEGDFRQCNTTGTFDDIDVCRSAAVDGIFDTRLRYLECITDAKFDML